METTGVAVGLVDLGLGNVRSVCRALTDSGAKVSVLRDPSALREFERLVVPGQGAFRDAGRALDEGGFRAPLKDHLEGGKPYLGLCLGMQLLLEGSDECPGVRGLAHVGGHVRRFDAHMPGEHREFLPVPHMGWNQLRARRDGWPDGAWVYFVHSYYCEPKDGTVVSSVSEYGVSFCSGLEVGAVMGCQFHPEKSRSAGQVLLRRFLSHLPGGAR